LLDLISSIYWLTVYRLMIYWLVIYRPTFNPVLYLNLSLLSTPFQSTGWWFTGW